MTKNKTAGCVWLFSLKSVGGVLHVMCRNEIRKEGEEGEGVTFFSNKWNLCTTRTLATCEACDDASSQAATNERKKQASFAEVIVCTGKYLNACLALSTSTQWTT